MTRPNSELLQAAWESKSSFQQIGDGDDGFGGLGGGFIGGWIASRISDCAKCNDDVADCMTHCLVDPTHKGNAGEYYCAAQGRYITIGPPPANFPDLASAQKKCEKIIRGSSNGAHF